MGFTVQPAVRKETCNVAIITGVGTVLMWIVLFVLNRFMPDDVPFDYTVILAGLGGTAVAVLNFFLMGLTIQKVVSVEDEKMASGFMKASFGRRMLLQIIWIIAALAAPCFFWIAGVLPLLFPSAGIKLTGILKHRKSNRQEVDTEQNGD